MPMMPIDASDGALLQVVAGLRFAADQITRHVSDHNAIHDHPLTECTAGVLIVSKILTGVAGSTSGSAAAMLEALVESME